MNYNFIISISVQVQLSAETLQIPKYWCVYFTLHTFIINLGHYMIHKTLHLEIRHVSGQNFIFNLRLWILKYDLLSLLFLILLRYFTSLHCGASQPRFMTSSLRHKTNILGFCRNSKFNQISIKCRDGINLSFRGSGVIAMSKCQIFVVERFKRFERVGYRNMPCIFI